MKGLGQGNALLESRTCAYLFSQPQEWRGDSLTTALVQRLV
jgi:hypothetical protein